MNELLVKYRKEREQEYIQLEHEEKIDRKITIFQGIMWLSIAVWMLVFALSHYYDALSIIATFLLVLSGILLCIYTMIYVFKRKQPEVSR